MLGLDKRHLNSVPPGARRALSLALAALLLGTEPGCAPRYSLSRDYQEVLRDTPQVTAVGDGRARTTVYILVDGLSVPAFERLRRGGRLPVLERYFLDRPDARVHTGVAVFPSLTFPNVASILASAPVDRHPVLGNEVYYGERKISYSSILNRSLLNQNLREQLLFTRLARQDRNSASLDRYFYAGATVRLADDIGDGLAYERSDFAFVDEKTLAAATRLLGETDARHWPAFVFIHLVGVDGLAHERGPFDPAVLDYTAWLDGKLKPLFRALERAERHGKQISAFLSADHGFVSTTRFADAQRALESLAPGARIANQSRLLSVGFPASFPSERQDNILSQLIEAPSVEMTLQGLPDGTIRVRTPGRVESLSLRPADCGAEPYAVEFSALGPDFHCSDYFDARPTPGYHPFLVSSVASYFRSPYHPDAVVLAAPGVSFTRGQPGQHGGLTPEEMLVPLLMRNAKISRDGPIRSWQVLRYLDPDDSSGPGRDRALLDNAYYKGGPRPASPPSPEVAEASLSLPDVQHGFEVSTPFSLTQLQFAAPDGSPARSLRTELSPGFGLRWHQAWSERLGSFVSYALSFDKFGLPPDGSLVQRSTSASQAALGAEYRFGEKQKLSLAFGMGEHYFLSEASAPGSGTPFEKCWIPELRFGTWNRLLSLPFADLVFAGSLALLAPPVGSDLPIHTGLAQSSGFYVEAPVGTGDVAGAGVRYEIEEQNAAAYDQRSLALIFGAYYGLSFLR